MQRMKLLFLWFDRPKGNLRENMNVLHVLSEIDPVGGGPVTALAGLAPAQRRAGVRVRVLATYKAGADLCIAERLQQDGVEVTSIGPTAGRLQRHPDLLGAMEAAVQSSDVIHIHGVWQEAQHLAARTASRYIKPYIIRPCGMLDPWCLRQNKWVKRIYMAWRLRRNLNEASAIHFTSETERELVAHLHPHSPAIVEPNGVDLAEFRDLPPRGVLRRRFPSIGDRKLVLFLSRLHHKKGLDLLIPAFAQTAEDQAALVIAGPDNDGYGVELEHIVRKHGIESRVFFTGMLRGVDRIEALVDADIFTLPSYQENFGIAVVEALAAGVPVIISDQVNIWQEIEAAGVGGVVPTDVDMLARELKRWLEDGRLRQSAAGRARGFVQQRYDWAEISRRWLEHYSGLMGAGSCRPTMQ